jgi:glucose/arabinose dehydrogenase
VLRQRQTALVRDRKHRQRSKPSRPYFVGVAIDKKGALLVADDVGNTIWRVSSANGG